MDKSNKWPLASPRVAVVGQRYWVPCVLNPDHDGRYFWVPIIGPLHEDKLIIGFEKEHFHYDLRFWSDRLISKVFGSWGLQDPARSLVSVLTGFDKGPKVCRRKCFREMPEFPVCGFSMALEKAYCEQRVNPANPICPHRGLPLVAPANEDGVVVCSGHGLSWNIKTGEMVHRTPQVSCRR